MKNLFLKSILILGLATTIVACSKDEETTTPSATIKIKKSLSMVLHT